MSSAIKACIWGVLIVLAIAVAWYAGHSFKPAYKDRYTVIPLTASALKLDRETGQTWVLYQREWIPVKNQGVTNEWGDKAVGSFVPDAK